jgi:carbonic anhydrase/acetyltransferase-like protein (isoleucine patch superfamily)
MLRLEEPYYLPIPRSWPEFDITIGAFTVIEASPENPVSIGLGVNIGHQVTISAGVTLAEKVQLDTQSFIGPDTVIGSGSEVHGVKVFRDVKVGSNSFIGGEVSNWTVIGNEVTFMGRIVHTYRKPGTADDWRNSPPQPSPIIGDRSVVGENAILMGGVKLGEGAYISAGEIVKFNVPKEHIVINGRLLPLSNFRGFIQGRG